MYNFLVTVYRFFGVTSLLLAIACVALSAYVIQNGFFQAQIIKNTSLSAENSQFRKSNSKDLSLEDLSLKISDLDIPQNEIDDFQLISQNSDDKITSQDDLSNIISSDKSDDVLRGKIGSFPRTIAQVDRSQSFITDNQTISDSFVFDSEAISSGNNNSKRIFMPLADNVETNSVNNPSSGLMPMDDIMLSFNAEQFTQDDISIRPSQIILSANDENNSSITLNEKKTSTKADVVNSGVTPVKTQQKRIMPENLKSTENELALALINPSQDSLPINAPFEGIFKEGTDLEDVKSKNIFERLSDKFFKTKSAKVEIDKFGIRTTRFKHNSGAIVDASNKQMKCLSEAVYFEARSEPHDGQVAVAQVVLNRVASPNYPNDICGVVYQNQHWRNRCQFSFTCDGIPETIRDMKSWAKAKKVAEDVISGKEYIKALGKTLHYHANYVRPKWARRMNKVKQIGVHIFYNLRG